ncbi:TonB-dependent receptor plug domain-containing protein [Leeuwenhoekiella sp. NPDC079379]|uniref:TonB-dependent receptor plug domain-containing protein n=1 Tax=Leeuwenhoekiella sp. NPDC079379 TaxID=3364122 RepID=UPI0037C9308E
MKYISNYIIILVMLTALSLKAQERPFTALDSVYLTDSKLKEFSTGRNLTVLSDTILRRNRPLLTNTLNFNTPIYFKENGLGMVSSPSFRGTTASQTAVLWNGININSQLNGQLDFNTVDAGAYSEIAVRGGGGSVVYGTGAIGGSVHLNMRLTYEDQLTHNLFLQYGSYNTQDARYNLNLGTKKWSLNLALTRNSSDNDFELPNGRNNLNGDFENTALNVGLGFKINSKNSIRIFSELFDGERHFSITRASETKTKYQDLNSKNLLEWEHSFGSFKGIARAAYLEEFYKYFANIDSEVYSFGKAKTFITKYDLSYKISDRLKLNSVLTNTTTSGFGSSFGDNDRSIFAAALLLKHQLANDFNYELGIRKEQTENYDSPFLFSFGATKALNDFFSLNINVSRNFRIPTYNDLYWETGGNLDLLPEKSLQGQLGAVFNFNSIQLNLTGYYNSITDMIRWLPGAGGIWSPSNVDEVEIYGLESALSWSKNFNKEHRISFNSTYAYTVSENKQTGNQLIYVPFHKATASVDYIYKKINAALQYLYVGEVFTRSDNNSRYNLDAYNVGNFSLGYSFGKKAQYELGARVNNFLNTEYQSVESRWMPGRNFNIYLNLKL